MLSDVGERLNLLFTEKCTSTWETTPCREHTVTKCIVQRDSSSPAKLTTLVFPPNGFSMCPISSFVNQSPLCIQWTFPQMNSFQGKLALLTGFIVSALPSSYIWLYVSVALLCYSLFSTWFWLVSLAQALLCISLVTSYYLFSKMPPKKRARSSSGLFVLLTAVL